VGEGQITLYSLGKIMHFTPPWRNWKQAKTNSLSREEFSSKQLNSSSHTFPVGGRACTLLTHQLLVRLLWRTPLLKQATQPLMKSLGFSILSINLSSKGTPPIATQPSISTQRRSRDPEKAPVTRDSTQIRNWKGAHSTLTELRGNTLLSTTRKKFGQ
jgi:hypothetical protein